MEFKPVSRRTVLKGGALLLSSSLLPLRGIAVQPEAPVSRFKWPVRPLMKANLDHALFVRNLRKSVEASLIVDDMESDLGWQASDAVKLAYSTERVRTGKRSLCFSTEQRNEQYIKSARAQNGSFNGGAPLFDFAPGAAWARLKFSHPQDWSGYNRLSLWCYLVPSGNPISSVCLQFLCDGAEAGPYDPVSVNYFGDLKEGEWNQLTWEISEFKRDRISQIMIFQPLSGVPFRRAPSSLVYYFDELKVERVAVEQVSGWDIAPGKMAYSHVGYALDGEKIAISAAQALPAFELLDAASGEPVASFPVKEFRSPRGHYSVYDFSTFRTPGTYQVRAGGLVSEPFPVTPDVWRPLVESTLNTFYGLRCGFAVPGVHDACHCDVLARFEGDTRSVGGGWHDAANLAQDTENTNSSIVSLLDLSESLAGVDAELSSRALEEATWGLEWILRLRFKPGIRLLDGPYSYYTDGLTGTDDDVILENPRPGAPAGDSFFGPRQVIGSDTFKNLGGALAEVRGARALKSREPQFARELLQAAEEDFATVVRDRPEPPVEQGEPNWHVQPWQNETGFMALTAVELYRETGKASYAELAVRYAQWALDVQEFRFLEGSPVTGYFYEDAAKTRILRELQRTSGAMNSFEEGACLAYQALCDSLPQHADWIKWYEGLVAYSEYFCRTGVRASAPFNMVPAAVWREQDLEAPTSIDMLAARLTEPTPMFPTPVTAELTSRQKRQMYQAGTELSAHQRLRLFPMPIDHIRHGGTTVHLTKTLGLAAAAQSRHGPELSDLTAQQVRWLVGMNPFSRSLIYGVGYDYWQNFTVSLPNLYGGMAVGMNTYQDDSPAWGNNALFPYKEIWVQTSSRFAAVLARLVGKAIVKGRAPKGASFLAENGAIIETSGSFSLQLAPGRYVVRYGEFEKRIHLVSGARYDLYLDPAHALELTLREVDLERSQVTLEATGSGRHVIELRASNVRLVKSRVSLALSPGKPQRIAISLDIEAPARSWLLLAVPNSQAAEAVEVFSKPVWEIESSASHGRNRPG